MAEAIRSDFAPSLGDLFGEDCLDFFLNMRSGCTTTVWSFLWMLFLGDCLPPPKMVIGCRITGRAARANDLDVELGHRRRLRHVEE